MALTLLPFDAPLARYREQADGLCDDPGDARLAVAQSYGFRDWAALETYANDIARPDSGVARFEAAVEAVVDGALEPLASLLDAHPDLVTARSTRITDLDPPVHRATLLHYVAANGVEPHRQRTPPNAVAIAKLLLERGAEPDALADMYGEPCTPMSMLVSSAHPARAGVQVALVDILVDHGASLEAHGGETWGRPLVTALVFGYAKAAERLVARGVRVDDLAAAAGLGYEDTVRRMLPSADTLARHRALALAAQLGHPGVVSMLLDAGEDPNRHNPKGLHSHSTPLHQAVAAGHETVVHLLVERGARLDLADRIHEGTPLDWAEYLKKASIERFLRAREAEQPRKPK